MDKKYTDFMDEISSDELYEGLLAYGLFAKNSHPYLLLFLSSITAKHVQRNLILISTVMNTLLFV